MQRKLRVAGSAPGTKGSQDPAQGLQSNWFLSSPSEPLLRLLRSPAMPLGRNFEFGKSSCSLIISPVLLGS